MVAFEDEGHLRIITMSDSEAEAAQVNYPEIFGFGRYQGRSWREAVVEDNCR